MERVELLMSAGQLRRWFVCLAVVVLGMVLVGCSKPVPTEDEIVGTWVSHGTDGWGEPGGSVVFDADGTFTARGVPEGLLGVSREGTPMDGQGTWSIGDGWAGDSKPGVQIVYPGEPPAVHHLRLIFASNRGTLSLTYWNDYDRWERYILVKQE